MVVNCKSQCQTSAFVAFLVLFFQWKVQRKINQPDSGRHFAIYLCIFGVTFESVLRFIIFRIRYLLLEGGTYVDYIYNFLSKKFTAR